MDLDPMDLDQMDADPMDAYAWCPVQLQCIKDPATPRFSHLYRLLSSRRVFFCTPLSSPSCPSPVLLLTRLITPPPPAEAARVQVFRGRNIKSPPVPPDLPEELEGRVLIVLGDNISTGSMSPDGVLVMQERSNIPAIAEYCFRKEDPEFVARAKQAVKKLDECEADAARFVQARNKVRTWASSSTS